MRILDRYLLRTFGRMFGLTTGAFAGIYLLIEFFERVDDFIEHHGTLTQYLRYFGWKLPIIFVDIAPLAVLLSVFLTLGSFTRHGELTAMRACGLSLARIARPLMLAALLISTAHFFAGDMLVPHGVRETRHILKHELVGRPMFARKQNMVWFREGDAIVFVKLILPQKELLKGVTIYRMDKEFHLRQRIDAATARYSPEKGWILHDLVLHGFSDAGDVIGEETRASMPYPLDKSPGDFQANQLDNRELGFAELLSLTRRLAADGYDTTRYRVDLHNRLAYSATCFIMACLGLPFALQRGRGSHLALGIAISVGIGIGYFLLQSTMIAFGYAGVLPPWAAAWSGNILTSLLAAWLILARAR